MDLIKLQEIVVRRCEAHFHPINAWSPAEWGLALAGECGEVCDAVKKLRRVQDGTNTAKDPQSEAAAIFEVGRELADLQIYSVLLAARLGIDLPTAIMNKFNEVSQRIASDIRIDDVRAWRCFHCNEFFTDAKSAREHFGASVECKPLCQIFGTTVRNMEKELAAYRNEDTELHREIAHLKCEHQQALMRAEEAGYAKGLRDGRELAEPDRITKGI